MTSGSKYERELKKLLESDGWFVVRSAGSLAVDLVAVDLENGNTMLLEVKSFRGNVFRVSRTQKSKEQYEEMCSLQNRTNGHCLIAYALRKKGKGDYRLVLPSKLNKPYHWDKESVEPMTPKERGLAL